MDEKIREREEILVKALAYYEKCIRMLPSDAIDEKAMAHEPLEVARALLWTIGIDYSDLKVKKTN